ncbi:MAG: hypothetical protein J7K61_01480 [Thermoplasmata archaeon]|nr:hypothetical protein [Thermoplasmata archaeon]
MRKLPVAVLAFAMLIMPSMAGMAGNADESSTAELQPWIKINEPTPGIYYHGQKIMDSKFCIFIGQNDINVTAIASSDIMMVYFSASNVMSKEVVENEWDTDKADGFSHSFALSRGIYVIAAVGVAVDINNPVAFDWIPVVIL